MGKNKIVRIMNEEMIVALGCTDPVAIAYAAAAARKLAIHGEINEISVSLSKGIIKSAAAVKIPGTNVSGVEMAAVLGALFGNPEKKLEVLDGISNENVIQAKKFIDDKKFNLSESNNNIQLYVEVEIKTKKDTAKTVLMYDYCNLVYSQLNGEIVFDNSIKKPKEKIEDIKAELSLEEIWEFINEADIHKNFEVVKKSILLNQRIANEGLKNKYGLQVGRTMKSNAKCNDQRVNILNNAVALTAAGADARMAGIHMAVMSNSGSGNQGITATVPVVTVAEILGLDEEMKIRAVALSNLVTIHGKEYFGRISALCGANIAAMGASSGIVYLLGGGLNKVKATIQNMAGNITGMICDGAKAGCALKIATSTQAAVQSAYLAIDGIEIQKCDGIVEEDVEDTFRNIGKLSSKCSFMINNIIVDIMGNKVK